MLIVEDAPCGLSVSDVVRGLSLEWSQIEYYRHLGYHNLAAECTEHLLDNLDPAGLLTRLPGVVEVAELVNMADDSERLELNNIVCVGVARAVAAARDRQRAQDITEAVGWLVSVGGEC